MTDVNETLKASIMRNFFPRMAGFAKFLRSTRKAGCA